MKLSIITQSLLPLASFSLSPYQRSTRLGKYPIQDMAVLTSLGRDHALNLPNKRRSSVHIAAEGEESREVSNNLTTELISKVSVMTLGNEKVDLASLLPSDPDRTVILACLSHFGDFNAWEVTQQYIAAIDAGELGSDCNVVLVGIGSVDSARNFAADLSLDNPENTQIKLVADEGGAATEAFGCYRGWLAIDKAHAEKWPATDVSPYIKLFGMIVGLGSPGTIGKVLYGYVGDKNGGKRSRKWVIDSLLQGSDLGRWPKLSEEAFDGIPEDSGLRPFELATLRAQTGIHIVLNWKKLGPKNGDLFTRMGGTFVFRGGNVVYSYFDKGILVYAPQGDVIVAATQ